MATRRLRYYTNCVSWPRTDVEDGLQVMIDDARDVTYATFVRHVDPEDWEELQRNLGYAIGAKHGLHIRNDYHVQYRRSKLHGVRVYYMIHSATEYVFTPNGKNPRTVQNMLQRLEKTLALAVQTDVAAYRRMKAELTT